MEDNTITHDAPALVTTTVQPSHSQPASIEESTFRIKDIQVLLGLVVAFVLIATFFINRAASKRTEDRIEAEKRSKADREDATERTQKIMDSIQAGRGDASRDVRELTDKVKDGRTVMEKDIQALGSKIDHERKNREAASAASAHLLEKLDGEMRRIDHRMTTQEEKSRAQDATIGKLESLIREKIDEVKEVVKAQGALHTSQFSELAASLREARDAKFKG